MDTKEIIDFLHAIAHAVGAEVFSPWFYLQFGLPTQRSAAGSMRSLSPGAGRCHCGTSRA
jgi:hypothetical protein